MPDDRKRPAGGLAGRRILLTRDEDDCAGWASEIRKAGALPVVFPCIECHDIDAPELRARLAAELPLARWLAFTSRRGVSAFARLRGAGGVRGASPIPASVAVAAVGPATARAAADALGRVDLAGGPHGTAASLAGALVPRLGPGDRVLVAVAENAGRTLESAIEAAGRSCVRLDLYRTLPSPRLARRHASSALGADNVLFASPSAVAGFVNQVRLDSSPGIFTIGPATTEAARAAGLGVTGEAARPGLEGLLEAMRCAS